MHKLKGSCEGEIALIALTCIGFHSIEVKVCKSGIVHGVATIGIGPFNAYKTSYLLRGHQDFQLPSHLVVGGMTCNVSFSPYFVFQYCLNE